MAGIKKKARENRRKWRWGGWGLICVNRWASLVAQLVKKSACNVGNLGSIPGMGRSPGEGNSYPLQYSGLEDPHGQRNLEGYRPWGHKESDTTEQLELYVNR